MKIAWRNGPTYQMLENKNLSFEFSAGYVVEVRMRYSETYAPVAAYVSGVYQIVVLNSDFEPVLIGLQTANIIS